ncbi:MAG: hypothetical protein HY360_19140 [Verrucomicrobia bacterium]|nr:hypothetical protein [Verrucomicrobiota bacterium]
MKTNQAPQIDGVLDDACWKSAAQAVDFMILSSNLSLPVKALKQTRGMFAYDEKNFYFAVECEEPDPGQLRATSVRDGDVWGDDSVELFFDVTGKRTDYVQLIVNSKGVFYDGDKQGPSWNSNANIKARVGEKAWWVEGAVPLNSFGVEGRRNGQIWNINIGRNDRVAGITSSWVFLGGGGFANLEKFVAMTFSAAAARTRTFSHYEKAKAFGLVENPDFSASPDEPSKPNRWALGESASYDGRAVEKGLLETIAEIPVAIHNLNGKTLRAIAYVKNICGFSVQFRYQDARQREAVASCELPLTDGKFALVRTSIRLPTDAKLIDRIRLLAKGGQQAAGCAYLQLEQPKTMTFAYNNPDGDITANDQAVFYPAVPETGVCQTMPLPLMWTSWHTFKDTATRGTCQYLSSVDRKYRLILDVPDGVQLSSFNEFLDFYVIASVKKEPIKRQSQDYIRYTLSTALPFYGLDMNFLTTLPAGKERVGYYQLRWEGGQSRECQILFKTIQLPKVRLPKRLMTGIHIMTGEGNFQGKMPEVLERENYGNYAEHLKNLGFNTVILWVPEWRGGAFARATPKLDAFVAHLKKNGIRVIGEHGVFGCWKRPLKPEESVVYLDGKGSSIMCPSYRGELYQDEKQVTATLASHGMSEVDWDWELYNYFESKVCFCRRCKDKFQQYLREKYPDVKYVDPQVFESGGNGPLHEKWLRFKDDLVMDWIDDFRNALAGKLKERPGGERASLGLCCLPTGFDWNRISKHVERMSPMLYAYYGTRPEPTVRSVGDDTYAFYQAMDSDPKKLAPTLAPGNSQEVPASGANAKVPDNEMVYPRIGMKYQILEVIAGGAGGFSLYYWAAMDGMAFKYVAEAINMIAPVEDIILDGRLEDVKPGIPSVKVRKIRHPKGVVLFVSEYSLDPLELKLTEEVAQEARVIDLDTGESVARLTPGHAEFQVTLDKERARLFFIGNPKHITLTRKDG